MTLKDQRFYFFKREISLPVFKKIKSDSHLAHPGEMGCRPQALGDKWTVRPAPSQPPEPVPSAASVGWALPNLERLSCALKPAALAGPSRGSRWGGRWGGASCAGSRAWCSGRLRAAGSSRHPQSVIKCVILPTPAAGTPIGARPRGHHPCRPPSAPSSVSTVTSVLRFDAVETSVPSNISS